MLKGNKLRRLNELTEKLDRHGMDALSEDEKREAKALLAEDKLSADTSNLDRVAGGGYSPSRRSGPASEEVRGEPNEPIQPGRFTEWYNKAQENGVRDERGVQLSRYGKDYDLNAYFGARMGFTNPNAETRALGEDTVGSGQALAPISFLPQFVDVLLPNTIAGKVGFNQVAMDNETVNMPVFTSTVSPTWIAEAGSISLDANPAFSQLKLFAPGGVKDITQYSVELAQDAFIQGTLPTMLANAVAKKMAVVLDTAALLGIAGNTGVPGLNGETGFVFRKQTGDSGTAGLAPTTTTELGVVAEQAVKANVPVEQLAYVSNVGCQQAFLRLPLTTYGRYFDRPPLVVDTPWVTSENSALPYVETDPATASTVAQSGGSYTSLYCGPWSRFAYIGWRLQPMQMSMTLNERYIDSGEIGLFSMVRFSVRYAHPETFSRTIGVIPV